jgi:steroid delta-isomerase
LVGSAELLRSCVPVQIRPRPSFRGASVSPASAGLAAILVLLLAAPAIAQPPAEAEIRAALERWTEAFNAGRADEVCDLFAKDLIARYRGAPERGYERQCQALRAALADPVRRSHNALLVEEVLVFGDVAVVRVVWTETVRDTATGTETRTVEPGLDVFRREGDGRWRILRYLAFDEE